MKLVERHIIKKKNQKKLIKKNDKRYNELDNLCFLSKNLYNQALYRIRIQFFKDKSFKNYYIRRNQGISKEMDEWQNIL